MSAVSASTDVVREGLSIGVTKLPLVDWTGGLFKPISEVYIALRVQGSTHAHVFSGTAYTTSEVCDAVVRTLVPTYYVDPTKLSRDVGFGNACGTRLERLLVQLAAEQGVKDDGGKIDECGADPEEAPREFKPLILDSQWNPWLVSDAERIDCFEKLRGCIGDESVSEESISSAISGIDAALWEFRAMGLGIRLAELFQREFNASAVLSELGRNEDAAASCYPLRCEGLLNRVKGYCTVELDPATKEESEKVVSDLLTKWKFRSIKGYSCALLNFQDGIEVEADSTSPPRLFRDEDLEMLRWLRSFVGKDVDLQFDAMGFREEWCRDEAQNHRWALQLAEVLEREGYKWLEEPLPPKRAGSIAAYHGLVQAIKERQDSAQQTHSRIWISGCESLLGVDSFQKWIEGDSVNLIQPDVSVCGGPSVVLCLKYLAFARAMQVAPHGYGTARGLRVDAALQSMVLSSGKDGCTSNDTVREDMKVANELIPDHLVEVPTHVLEQCPSLRLDDHGCIPVEFEL
eukprot:TRINITY_DN31045_c0_g1_i1.p1 TRINITY_DN31045_c0_g1~~TRINITY_DN31045_c0_g1_i1.p1  ORF type:complete len:517 (-),score=76.21 TRINITY_DN31045_c0_g1_i1:96-1646(-)